MLCMSPYLHVISNLYVFGRTCAPVQTKAGAGTCICIFRRASPVHLLADDYFVRNVYPESSFGSDSTGSHDDDGNGALIH